MIRVQFANDASGTGAYTLPLNPVDIQCEDAYNSVVSECLDSESVIYDFSFDNRPIEMIWTNWNVDKATFSGLVATLKTYKYTQKYIKLNELQSLFVNIFTSTGYNGPYRIGGLTPKIRSGSGKTFEELRLTLYKSE